MNKTLLFIFIFSVANVDTAFQLAHAYSPSARKVDSHTPPSDCAQILAEPEMIPEMKIRSFYGEEDSVFYLREKPRFFDWHLGAFFEPNGQALEDQQQFDVPIDDTHSVRIFHRLNLQKNFRLYAGLLGLSVISVAIQRAPLPFENREDLQHEINQEIYFFQYLYDHKFPAAMPMGQKFDEAEGHWILFREYVPGPTLTQFKEWCRDRHPLLDRQICEKGLKDIKDLKSKLHELNKSEEYRSYVRSQNMYNTADLASDRTSFPMIDVADENFVFSEGQWKITGISTGIEESASF